MGTIKSITFWIIWIALLVIKVPISIVSAIVQFTERQFTDLLRLLVKWTECEWIIETFNYAIDSNAEAYEYLGNDYLDAKIEL